MNDILNSILVKAIMPLLAATFIGGFMLFRRHDQKERHRSFMQWAIYVMRRSLLRLWAINAGFDAGYLSYRHVLDNYTEQLINEEALGLLLGAAETKETDRHARTVVTESLA
jgi:hypothetical protein